MEPMEVRVPHTRIQIYADIRGPTTAGIHFLQAFGVMPYGAQATHTEPLQLHPESSARAWELRLSVLYRML